MTWRKLAGWALIVAGVRAMVTAELERALFTVQLDAMRAELAAAGVTVDGAKGAGGA